MGLYASKRQAGNMEKRNAIYRPKPQPFLCKKGPPPPPPVSIQLALEIVVQGAGGGGEHSQMGFESSLVCGASSLTGMASV